MNTNQLKIGMAQIAPIWLDRKATTDKICHYVELAARESCDLVVFGEAVLPGYPFWLSFTEGASFNSTMQKEMFAHYAENAVCIEEGHLDSICRLAGKYHLSVYLGVVERPMDRGGHSLYCSLIYIDQEGNIASVHRKLQPTYEERLVWSPGDGHGLVTHKLKSFRLGGLNCWENWMPLSRTALYGKGENVHIATWPGSVSNTEDITRFIAKEGRSYVISVSSVLTSNHIPADLPHRDYIVDRAPKCMANGGSCIAGPDGDWIVEPTPDKEELICAGLEYSTILRERQNFDPVGHYSRPDVTKLFVDRSRQSAVDDSRD